MTQPGPCPHCGRAPVKTKTWSMLTDQDDLIKQLRQRIAVLEAQAKQAATKDQL